MVTIEIATLTFLTTQSIVLLQPNLHEFLEKRKDMHGYEFNKEFPIHNSSKNSKELSRILENFLQEFLVRLRENSTI